MQGLTQRQQMVLDFIRQSITERGYPPTLREIGARMGIRSTNGVNDHLRALERKGYLTREDMKSRALRPTSFGAEGVTSAGAGALSDLEDAGALHRGLGGRTSYGTDDSPAAQLSFSGYGTDGARSREERAGGSLAGGATVTSLRERAAGGLFGRAAMSDDDDLVEVPVLGRVAAGLPLLAEEHIIDTVRVDRVLVKGGREVFGLRVQGDSMIDAGILSGDYIFVKKQLTASRGDIVVALIGDEATVKFYYPERDYVRFQPANKAMAPILVRASDFKPTMLLGVVVGVYRRL
jgi:repressor LexA